MQYPFIATVLLFGIATATPQSNPSTAVPSLNARSSLQSLASARGDENRCEVLLTWIQSGKADTTRMSDMRRIFRDEPMTAVFGIPYDRTENRWRLEQYDKVISKCLGIATAHPTRNIPAIRGIPLSNSNRPLQHYPQQFAQYRQLLDQAFLGQPGLYEPSALSRYVQEVRDQMGWANRAIAISAGAPATRESFNTVSGFRRDAAAQLSLLNPTEKRLVEEFLSRRQSEIAPGVVDEWLRQAGSTTKDVASAKALHQSRNALAPVLQVLDLTTRVTSDQQYNRLIESLIQDPLQSDVARLSRIPATIPGVQQLASMKAVFESQFGELRGIPAIDAAREEYAQTRNRALNGALPSWREQVDRLPLQAPAVAAKHQELEALFPTREDRTAPVFQQYEVPLRSKEDQLRAQITAVEHKQPAPQPAADQHGPVTATSLNTRGLTTATLVTKFFAGDFLNIDLDVADMGFNVLFQQYLNAYARQCNRYLPSNRVEMTTSECQTERVTRNGYGAEISRGCVAWRTVGTGLYADPVLYDAKKAADRQRAGNALRETSRMMGNMSASNPISAMMNMLGDAQALAGDMNSLVEMNGCTSPGLKRFEENVRLFALNKQPIRLDGTQAKASSVTVVIPGIPFKDQNYTRLIGDLVADDATKWGAFAKLVPGSVTGSSVVSRDDAGRPAKVTARYSWVSLGRTTGTVTLTFNEGTPECLYYSETPTVCHRPNHKIVASYIEGGYQQ
jgi:hypothetical protein